MMGGVGGGSGRCSGSIPFFFKCIDTKKSIGCDSETGLFCCQPVS